MGEDTPDLYELKKVPFGYNRTTDSKLVTGVIQPRVYGRKVSVMHTPWKFFITFT